MRVCVFCDLRRWAVRAKLVTIVYDLHVFFYFLRRYILVYFSVHFGTLRLQNAQMTGNFYMCHHTKHETYNLWHYIENITAHYKQREVILFGGYKYKYIADRRTALGVPHIRVPLSANGFHIVCVLAASLFDVFYSWECRASLKRLWHALLCYTDLTLCVTNEYLYYIFITTLYIIYFISVL